MHRLYITALMLYPYVALAVFNPTPGDQLWAIAAETGRITSAVEGTQTRIQQSDLVGGTYTISSPGRYAVVEDLTAPAGAITIDITASNVYLDLNGFTIDGTGGGTSIINASAGTTNIHISNGMILNAPTNALNIASTTQVYLKNIHTKQSGTTGFQIQNTAICFLSQCSSTDSTTAGITTNNASRIIIQDYTSEQDGIGINIINSNQITIAHSTIYTPGTAGIASSANATKINISHTSILNSMGTGIQLDDTTYVTMEHIVIDSPASDGVSLQGSSTYVTCNYFDILSSGASGITINNNILSVIIKNSTIISTQAYGIFLANNNQEIMIDAVDIISTSSHGIFANNPYATSQPSGTSRIAITHCNVEKSGGHGLFFTIAPSLAATGIVFDSCTSIGNNGDGFRLDRSGSGIPYFDFTNILNCTASSNNGSGFMLRTGNSLIKGNIAQYNLNSNMMVVYPFKNTIIGNSCTSQAGGFNFIEIADGSTSHDMYLNNYAGAGSNLIADNYSLANSTLRKTDLRGDGSSAPNDDDLTHWVNISASQT